MKKSIYYLVLMLFLLMGSATIKNAVADNPPPPPGGHGTSGNQAPAGAPIDGGLGILLAMGAVYGGIKLYQARKEKQKKVMQELS
ncbi:MAG: hypothetical protein M0Q38_03650 [Bacteroidales bacterium]|jgi:hypothetical protein|nr:hypothetical protein [Bacteroidales bacterium]